jgi:diacylglycerol kinase family enzyme
VAAPLETLERLASDHGQGLPGSRQRMLVIVNPYATTVSDRLKNLVVYALRGRYEVEAIDTQGRGHATALCRAATGQGYDVVVAFGGDGTVNEAANGLAGSRTCLTCLPGGSTNVYCRMLGIPDDVVDATEHLLGLADQWSPRAVDLARVNDRYFTFASGIGLDASVVERVQAHPRLKARLGEYYFTYAAIVMFTRRYLIRPPRMTVEVAGQRVRGVTVIVQNGSPYTYFNRRRIEVGDGANLRDGALAGGVLVRASPLDMPTIIWRAFSKRARLARHRHVHPYSGVEALSVESEDGQRLPLQVDGDYIGEVTTARYTVRPRALWVVG